MITTNDKTFVNVKTSTNQSTDILNRIYKSIEIMQDKEYKVISVGCSTKVFSEISRRFAPKIGFLARETLLLQQKRKPADIPFNIPLKRDSALIYNEDKQFYLKVTDFRNIEGMVFPTFPKPIKIGDS